MNLEGKSGLNVSQKKLLLGMLSMELNGHTTRAINKTLGRKCNGDTRAGLMCQLRRLAGQGLLQQDQSTGKNKWYWTKLGFDQALVIQDERVTLPFLSHVVEVRQSAEEWARKYYR